MRKIKKKQILALIICLYLFAGVFLEPACTSTVETDNNITTVNTSENSGTEITSVSNTTTNNQTQNPVKKPKKYYYFVDEFSDVQGPVWYYLSTPAGGATYSELKYIDTDWGYSAWATDKDYLFALGFITENEMIPGFNHDSVIAFKAPYTGKIRISSESGEVQLADSTGVTDGSTPSDGAEFGIFLYSAGNLTKLYPQGEGTVNSGMEFFKNGESKDFESIEIDIKKNEMIWFRGNSGPDGRNDHDSIFFKPEISYLSMDENDAGIENADNAVRVDRPAGSSLVVATEFDKDKIITTDKHIISGEKDKVLDFTGYKYIVDEFVVENCNNITIKNLAIESNGGKFSINGGENIAIKDCYFKNTTIVCNTLNGSWIENNIIENDNVTGIEIDSNGTAIYNTVTLREGNAITGIYADATWKTNILVALNIIKGTVPIGFGKVTNGVILLNELPSITAALCDNIIISENTFTSDGDNIFLENVSYSLGTNNKNLKLSAINCNNLSGEDFNDSKLPELGANEDLLPKLNKELFVGMERKVLVNDGGNTQSVNNYIALKYGTSKYVIIPPGAYSVNNSINLTEYKDYTIYAYGVLCEYNNYANIAVQMTDCENVAIKGMYIDFTVPPNGQAVITDVSNNAITFKMDDGYNQNLLDPNKYAINDTQSANIQWYKQGEKTVSNVSTQKVKAVNQDNGEFSIPKNAFNQAKVGDKLVFRGRDRFVTYFDGCSNMKLEDYTMYGGGGFGFMERDGDKSTVLNRLAVVPGPAPVLTNGERGAERLTSTCDSTHSTNMRHGPQMTNCLFESATDDGTNINAEFGSVTDFDPNTMKVTYTKGNNDYPGLCVDFKTGDRVMIYNKNGGLLCDATAVSDTEVNGDIRTVKIDKGDFAVKRNIVIQNASASGNGFLIQNTRLYGNWTKGFLIKAIGGEISNCTFDRVGITAIYLCPEIKDGHWNECGYSEDILIKNNLITETGYMYSDDIYSTVINIRSDAGITDDPAYMMMKNITVTGNKVIGRHTKYALNINGGSNILVENNDWGYMYGKDASNDKQTSATITTSSDIQMNNNIYPPLSAPKIKITKNSVINIFGTDIDGKG